MKKYFKLLKTNVLFIILMMIVSASYQLSVQKISRDLNVDLLINQAGYTPSAAKTVVVKGKISGKFYVVDIATMKVVHIFYLKISYLNSNIQDPEHKCVFKP